ncbi:MAG: hypothetical protein WC717_01160 [Candidatus Micrarchaeia archaeon]|jgi:hypothetical protein
MQTHKRDPNVSARKVSKAHKKAQAPGKFRLFVQKSVLAGTILTTAVLAPFVLRAQTATPPVNPFKPDLKQSGLLASTSGSGAPTINYQGSADSTLALASSNLNESGSAASPKNLEPYGPPIEGKAFCDVKISDREIQITNYIPKDNNGKAYSFAVDIENALKNLNATAKDVTNVFFQENEDGSRQILLILKNGIITAYPNESELVRCAKVGEKINTTTTSIGCSDGSMDQWKIGVDGTVVVVGSSQIMGVANTVPRIAFGFDYSGGDIKDIRKNDNTVVITVGYDLLIIAPDLGYNFVQPYDGETVFGPVATQDGRVFMATQKNLLIDLPGGKKIEQPWSKIIPGLNEVENVELKHVGDFVDFNSISFKNEDNTMYKIRLNLTTLKLSKVQLDVSTVMAK